MFKITEGDFKNQVYGNESYLSNWPMLYILENGKQAYIGESNHVKNRMAQHHNSSDKRIFDKVILFIHRNLTNQLRLIMKQSLFSILRPTSFMRLEIKIPEWRIKSIMGNKNMMKNFRRCGENYNVKKW